MIEEKVYEDNLSDDSDDESVVKKTHDDRMTQLMRVHCSKMTKDIRRTVRYENAEKKKKKRFIADDDDESENEEESMLKRVESKAVDADLLHGKEIDKAVIDRRKSHIESVHHDKQQKKKVALNRLMNVRNTITNSNSNNTVVNSNNRNCNNVVNINVCGNAYFHPQRGTTMSEYSQVIQRQHPSNHQVWSTGVLDQANSHSHMNSQVYVHHMVHKYESSHTGTMDKKWIEKYKIALFAYRSDPRSLRGGYNGGPDPTIIDWVNNQKRHLKNMSSERMVLLNCIGLNV